MFRLVATCALGLEDFLVAELAALSMTDIERQRGAVTFTGGWEACWRANWRLRTANRVAIELGRWPAADAESLARGAKALVRRRTAGGGLDFGEWLHPRRTFSIRATSSASRQRDVRWVALKVKDGLVDGQRQRHGARSSIDRRDPDLQLRVWLYRDQATLLIDTSGESLDHRGYRVVTAEAPVREQLAAACVLAADWKGQGPIVDPMCGSGTLLAEAALIALGRPPRVGERSWAFDRLPGFDARRFAAIRDEPIPGLQPDLRLIGVDHSAKAIRAARTNLERAGLSRYLQLSRGDAFAFEPPSEPGLLLINPAYGKRLAELPDQWRKLGDLLKKRYLGWRAVVLAGDETKGKLIGLRPSRRLPVRHGPLDARILVFDLY